MARTDLARTALTAIFTLVSSAALIGAAVGPAQVSHGPAVAVAATVATA